ncbi:VWA domain containing CoxE-like protein [Anatilimnocola aggregata]|uniref:VWA domain containing CoxE-like protein n=1 Tax=Anatilimnocola aggregata TaxID=2528021 RepID=A0A517YG38_9BACT|nr:DUF58 domain-containing protein [Anatilimnocola aggregata]QDU29179.1 VWA domain containing CoxE-like protein [Anatilimnocola aggregata]
MARLPATPATKSAADVPKSASSRVSSFLDPATLMRIKNLELRARQVVQGFLSGMHRSPYHGFSVEFTEYRQYTPGDDPRYLDWRLYARSDRYYLKRFEDETNLRCYLLVDLSRSMAYSSLSYDKATYAKTAAATIAYFLSLQRDAAGLVTFDDRIREYLPARFRPGHLHRLFVALERATAGENTDLKAPLEQVAKTARKRGLVVLLSDLLAPAESLERELGYLRTQGHEVAVLRILDPAEIDFPFQDAAMFLDVETGRELYIDPEQARQQYQAKFTAHAAALKEICQRLGIDLYDLPTNKPLELALFDLLHARMRRGRLIARHRGGAR